MKVKALKGNWLNIREFDAPIHISLANQKNQQFKIKNHLLILVRLIFVGRAREFFGIEVADKKQHSYMLRPFTIHISHFRKVQSSNGKLHTAEPQAYSYLDADSRNTNFSSIDFRYG